MNTGPCGGVGVSRVLCQVGDVPSHSVTDARARPVGKDEVGVVGQLRGDQVRPSQRPDVAREREGADLERGVEDSVDDDVRPHLVLAALSYSMLCSLSGPDVAEVRAGQTAPPSFDVAGYLVRRATLSISFTAAAAAAPRLVEPTVRTPLGPRLGPRLGHSISLCDRACALLAEKWVSGRPRFRQR